MLKNPVFPERKENMLVSGCGVNSKRHKARPRTEQAGANNYKKKTPQGLEQKVLIHHYGPAT